MELKEIKDLIEKYKNIKSLLVLNGCTYCDDYKEIESTTAALLELYNYKEKEQNGLLPKFHLGDEFWTIRLGKILKAKIVMLQQKKNGSWQYRFSQEITPEYHDTVNYKENKFGKTVFFTEEDAQKALSEEDKHVRN